MTRSVRLPEAIRDLPFVVHPEDWIPPVTPEVLFGRPGPLEVELGCGKGFFLEQAVGVQPGTNYLGVERAEKYFRHAVRRFLSAPPANLRLLRADAFDLLSRWVRPASLAGVHVYFPDPWPKSRHAKRRLLQPMLYELAAGALAPGAPLRIASDVEPYFREAESHLLAGGLFDPVPWPEDAPDRLATNYAVKYAREGRKLQYAKFLRRTAVAPRC